MIQAISAPFHPHRMRTLPGPPLHRSTKSYYPLPHGSPRCRRRLLRLPSLSITRRNPSRPHPSTDPFPPYPLWKLETHLRSRPEVLSSHPAVHTTRPSTRVLSRPQLRMGRVALDLARGARPGLRGNRQARGPPRSVLVYRSVSLARQQRKRIALRLYPPNLSRSPRPSHLETLVRYRRSRS